MSDPGASAADPSPADAASTGSAASAARRRGGSAALLVGAGIFVSRIFGLVRQRALANYLGIGEAADAFSAAFRIPNLLQNLFGEGILSASFIPVYSSLQARGEKDEARRVANAVFGLLAVAVSVIVLAGVLAAPLLVDLLTPGFEGAKRDLTIRLVRMLYPAAGILVLSAWCLGVLNSHRRFLLSYLAPVVWNSAIIAALVWVGRGPSEYDLAVVAAWGALAGSALQLGVQLPSTLRLVGRFRPSLDRRVPGVQRAARSFGSVVLGRGVVQISGYIDMIIASLIGAGGVAILTYAQTLYVLPVSLFGMAVSAAELPAMASAVGSEAEIAEQLRSRLKDAAARVAFFIVPSAAGFIAVGDVIAAALFQTGAFSARDATWVWLTLAGSSVGLLAATLGRLNASAFYAMHDARTPLRFALVRVALSLALGFTLAVIVPRSLGVDPRWGIVGLATASGLAAWLEYALLRGALRRRIGDFSLDAGLVGRLGLVGVAAGGVAFAVARAAPLGPPIVRAAIVLGAFGAVYLGGTVALGVETSRTVVAGALRRVRRRG